MNLNEKEAREKWCPFARINASGGSGYNRLYSSAAPLMVPATRCIGSECMAWRWAEPVTETPQRKRAWPSNNGSFDDSNKVWVDRWVMPAIMTRDGLDKVYKKVARTEEEIAEDDDNGAPHYWLEPEHVANARHKAAVAVRVGYCGLSDRSVF